MYSIIQRHKRLAAVIIAVASVSFLFWMFTVSDIKQMFGRKGCVATVNGECIDVREFRYELLKYADILNDPDVEKVVKRQVLSNLVVREALFQRAKDLGFLASEGEVAERIKADRTFWEGDRFSVAKYREVLDRFGMTPQEYEDYVRKVLTIERIFKFLTAGVYLTEIEKDVRVTVDRVKFGGRAYLITEEYVKVEDKPSEDELRKYYEENREKFALPEEKEFLIWETKDKERAHSIYRGLKAGKIEGGYRTLSVQAGDDLDLPEAVNREIKRLNEQLRYTITKVKDTYYVIYLKEIKPKTYRSFEEVKDQVAEEVKKLKAKENLSRFANKIKDQLKEGKSPNVRYIRFEGSKVEEFVKLFGIDRNEVIKMVFSKERVFGPYRTPNGFTVLYIESRHLDKEKKVPDLGLEMLSEKKREIANLFVESVIRKARIDINEEYLK